MNKFKSQKGGITIFVIVSFLFTMALLIAIYWKSTNYQVTVLQVERSIKDTYGKDVNNVDVIYGELSTTVQAGEKAIGGNKEYTSGGYTAVIPEGWTVSGKTGDSTTHAGDETTISTGLVIYYIDDKTNAEIAAIDWTDSTVTENLRKTYDQFVWIPIPRANINKMFMCQSEDGTNSCRITLDANGEAYCSTHSSNIMAGRLYADPSMNNGNLYGEIFNASLTTQTYNENSGLREPAIITGSDGTSYDGQTLNGTMTYLSQISNILGTRTDPNEKYDSSANFKTTLQNEYNAIVKSVYNNEGYWVGRYETSGMVNTNAVGTIKVIAGASNTSGKNPNISIVNWYRMYAQQKKYAENKGMLRWNDTRCSIRPNVNVCEYRYKL